MIEFPPGSTVASSSSSRCAFWRATWRWACQPGGAPLVRSAPALGLLLTWCGVRGGISVALALSSRRAPSEMLIVMLTYAVVVFSILVQGLTVARLTRILGISVNASRSESSLGRLG